MTKREFLEELKEVLSEQLPQNQVAEHVSYYMNYIEEQKQNGSSEEEVLNMLGDPRLIARTILDTAPNSRENQNYFYEETTQDVQRRRDYPAKRRNMYILELLLQLSS